MSLVSTTETTTEQHPEAVAAVGGAGLSESVDGMLDGKNKARVEAATQPKAPALGEEEDAANKEPEEPATETSERPQTTKARSWGKGWFQTKTTTEEDNDPQEDVVDIVATSGSECAKETTTDEQALEEATDKEPVVDLTKEESATETSERPQTTKARSWGKGWFQTKATKEENNDPQEEVVDAVATSGSESAKETTTDEQALEEATDKEPVVDLTKEESATEPSERPQTTKARSWGKGWFQTSTTKEENDPTEEVVDAVATFGSESNITTNKQVVEEATNKELAIVLTKEEPATEASERPQTTKARSWGKGWFKSNATKGENNDLEDEVVDATSGSESTNDTTANKQVTEEATSKAPVVGLTKEEDSAAETLERPQTEKARSWGKGWFQTNTTKDANNAPAEEVVGVVATSGSGSTEDKQAVKETTGKEPVILAKEEPVAKEGEPSIEEGTQSTEASGLGKVWFLAKESMKEEEVEIKKEPVSTKGEPITQEETTPAPIKKEDPIRTTTAKQEPILKKETTPAPINKEEPIMTTTKQEPIIKKETTADVPKKVTDREPPSVLYSSSTGGSSDEVWC